MTLVAITMMLPVPTMISCDAVGLAIAVLCEAKRHGARHRFNGDREQNHA